MLARLADLPDDPDNWAFEVKWDGMRAIAFVDAGALRLETRTHNDVTAQYPDLCASLPAELADRQAVLDGEVIATDPDGRPSFQRLQSRMGLSSAPTIKARSKSTPVQFMAFDLLELDGRDLRDEPYLTRRERLRELFKDTASWKVPAHHVGDGQALLDVVAEHGMEGIVAKRLESQYRERQRGGDWRKVKLQRRQEFVIGGWTEGAGRRDGSFGSLLLGYHDSSGRLCYAGRVGTGFTDRTIVDIAAQLEPLQQESTPFDVGGPGGGRHPDKWRAMSGRAGPLVVHYAQPKLVCDVAFAEFTRDGTLRHPSFQGMRIDKDPSDVIREDA
jgi:bifunctional non-homologous end joining protein LigD